MNYVIFFIYSTWIQAMNQMLLCWNIWCIWFSHSSQILVCISLRYLNTIYEFLVNIQNICRKFLPCVSIWIQPISSQLVPLCARCNSHLLQPKGSSHNDSSDGKENTHTALQACVSPVCVCEGLFAWMSTEMPREREGSWEGRGGEDS